MTAKLVVLYGVPQDPAAFDTHYTETHVPLAERIPGLRRFDHGHVLGSADGSAPPYHYMAELYFEDADAVASGLASAEGQAAGADVANFATGGATLMIVEA
ncbi:MAG TPA: EthD family reductase [Solirubrobacteraceae bacterium]|nr:EthD family reductase [Solirubrobacteraceae bacterium]